MYDQRPPPIYVTKPFLPPLEKFTASLTEIWSNHILTNGGPMHQKLELELRDYLGVPEIALFNNGTVALLVALQVLGIRGEVITTPYTFVATSHSLLWNQLSPVFVDIDPLTLNIDPAKIEPAITSRTSAILPVHCYGNPCDVDQIQKIADHHGLRVIYDAAHAFGVELGGKSVLGYGDLSVLSFHATKVFNTFEGGAIVCSDPATKLAIDRLKNFGFEDETTVVAPGINGKMSEINAAFGLLQMEYIDSVLNARRAIDARYRDNLKGASGIVPLKGKGRSIPNCSYFPILVNADHSVSRDKVYDRLKEQNIYARRYFYPLLSDFPMYADLPSAAPDNLPVATQVAREILCLPIYPTLSNEDVDRISEIVAAG